MSLANIQRTQNVQAICTQTRRMHVQQARAAAAAANQIRYSLKGHGVHVAAVVSAAL